MRLWALCFILAAATLAQDWTQWGGPNRDFRLPSPLKSSAWPASGPTQIWIRELGDGYSSMVTAGGTVYTEYRKGTQEIVIALEAATGKTVWEKGIDAPHPAGMNIEAGPGPHSTPLIAGDRIFITTVIGHLVALDRKTGARLWSHDLWKEYKGNQVERGYASSPMAYKDSIIVPVGGPGRALMSFRQTDGVRALVQRRLRQRLCVPDSDPRGRSRSGRQLYG